MDLEVANSFIFIFGTFAKSAILYKNNITKGIDNKEPKSFDIIPASTDESVIFSFIPVFIKILSITASKKNKTIKMARHETDARDDYGDACINVGTSNVHSVRYRNKNADVQVW